MAGGFAVLNKRWIEVKKIHERAAAVLQEEIDARPLKQRKRS
jgi:hypothetical protein